MAAGHQVLERGHFDALQTALEKLHSYEVPEVIAIPVIDGSKNYLNWMEGRKLGTVSLAFIRTMDGVIVDSNPLHRQVWDGLQPALWNQNR